jgi:hypothetical protein
VVPVAVNVCAIVLPLDAVAPLAPVCEVTVHANVVPVTLLVNAILVAVPEHIVCVDGVAVAVGFGLTVIVTVIGVPGQPLAVGVTV